MKFLKRINIYLHKPKVFCIGMNKTGTTTMLKTFKKLNFRTAPQIKQEQDIGDINSSNQHAKIKKFCWKYNFFQDLPFSQGDFYQKIDQIFPKSKYILTVRDSEKWFKSLCNFVTPDIDPASCKATGTLLNPSMVYLVAGIVA